METKTYVRKPEIVEAVQLTAQNYEQVAWWCGGEVTQVKHRPLSVTIMVPNVEGNQSAKCFTSINDEKYTRGISAPELVEFIDDEGRSLVSWGDYIVREGNRFRVLKPHEREEYFPVDYPIEKVTVDIDFNHPDVLYRECFTVEP